MSTRSPTRTMPEVGERYLGTVVKTTDVRRVRLAAARQGRPAAHLAAAQAGRRQAGRERRGRRQGRPEAPGRDRRDRPARQALAGPGASTDAADADAEPAAGAGDADVPPCRPPLSPARTRHARSRRPDGGAGAPHRPARRPARRHRGDAGRALGRRSASGSGSARATRRRAQAGALALPRAPAVQGHRAAHRAGHRGGVRRGRRRDQRLHRARSTPATTPGCSTPTCRWRST